MADVRDLILAKLDDLAEQHQPCDPGADCLHRAVDGVRAAVEMHQRSPSGGWCGCGRWVWPCGDLRAIATAMGIGGGEGRG